ncbi:hypothetical protein [Streptomyces sp. NPDC048623]|uniref:hypothetical protein n=1 Tax=Streptomyces sp. NPDC048623 TaxID=3155761 RepID=UPI0034369CBD
MFYGLTGLGALLLRTQPGSAALEHVLTYLVAPTRPIEHMSSGCRAGGWATVHTGTAARSEAPRT